MDEIGRDLDRLAGLQPNWDSYGAPVIDPEVIAAARTFSSALSISFIVRPAVVPMSTGGLQFEWHSGKRTLELELENPETIHFLKWDANEGIKEEDVLSIRDVVGAAALIRWFTGGIPAA